MEGTNNNNNALTEENRNVGPTRFSIESFLHSALVQFSEEDEKTKVKKKDAIKEYTKILEDAKLAGEETLPLLTRDNLMLLTIPFGPATAIADAATLWRKTHKRLREDQDEFYHPLNQQKVNHIRWLQDFPTVLEETTPHATYYYFSAKGFLPMLRTWIERIEKPILRTQEKSLLFIDGAVKSGKTTLAKELLPFLLHNENLIKEDFCFAYLDLSELAGISDVNDKWKRIDSLFRNWFKEAWEDQNSFASYPHMKVRNSLRALKGSHVRRWIISLDEYHFIFNRLTCNEMETMAEQMKLMILDNDSPCYFVLAGSTQATFWWSLEQARPNGLNMMTGATVVTTPFVSNDQEIDLSTQVLIQKENAKSKDLQDILDLVALKNVVNLCQVSRRLTTGTNNSPKDAYDGFVASKMEVYWRDYFAVPQGISPDKFISWANGSVLQPPSQLEHLMEKRGNLYYLRDPNFDVFLKTYYDTTTHQLTRFQAVVPWADVLLFAPLLPLGQSQKDLKIDEAAFEAAGYQLDGTLFDQGQWNAFAQFLTQHPANPAYVHKQPNQLTWVLVMRMLRNIVAHEHSVKWIGVTACLNQVLLYTKTRQNLRTLIHTYEQALIP